MIVNKYIDAEKAKRSTKSKELLIQLYEVFKLKCDPVLISIALEYPGSP